MDSDITAVEVNSCPSLFQDGFKCDETPSDDGEDNKEDAGSGIGAAGGGRPGIGEKRGVVIVNKDHGHGH